MTNEELAQLIQGGRDDLMSQLWEQCHGWVAKMAIRWYTAFDGRRGVELDDLINAGYLALVRAVESYDPSAGGAFITWLTYHLKTAFCDTFGIRTEKGRRDPLNNAASLDAPVNADDPDSATLGDITPGNGESAFDDIMECDYQRAMREAIDAVLSELPPREADTIRRRYFKGETLGSIAKDRGVSTNAVSQSERKAIREIRRNKKAMYRLQEFSPYSGTSLGTWRRTGMSVEEYWLILREQYGGGTPDTYPSA